MLLLKGERKTLCGNINSGVRVGTCESAEIGTSGGLKRDVSECLRFYDFFKGRRCSCIQPMTARERLVGLC